MAATDAAAAVADMKPRTGLRTAVKIVSNYSTLHRCLMLMTTARM